MRLTWVPNAKHRADPSEVLREAIKDSAKGRYELALRKHIWFHRSATNIRPGLSGVRLSYALSAWNKLSEKYPPARAALLRVRRIAALAARKAEDPWQPFHELASINSYFGNDENTVALFLELNRRSFKKAKRVYSLVEPILIRAGNYKICAKYLDPDRFSRIRKLYRVNLRLAKDPSIGPNFVQFAQDGFAEKTTRLIALLSLNSRTEEARQIGRRARRVWRNAEFHSRIAAAERGKFSSGDQCGERS